MIVDAQQPDMAQLNGRVGVVDGGLVAQVTRGDKSSAEDDNHDGHRFMV
jgi:hypothetical protein